jgi:SAM-dependent methyltransferase
MSDYQGGETLEIMEEAVNYNRFLLSMVRSIAKPGDRIVDIGAGIGTFAIALAREGYRVHCVEPDARQAAVVANAGVPVVATLGEIEDHSLDFVYALNVLEHIDDDRGAIRQWREKLKPLGRMLVYVPAYQVLYSSFDRKVGHFRRYRKRELIAKVAQAGFLVMDARYVDSLGFFAALWFRFFGDDAGRINRQALVLYDRLVFPLSRLCDVLVGPLFGKNVVVVASAKGLAHGR